jgi:hypothetical protein
MATLFFSYSHRDEILRNELEVHLSMLKKQGVIETWHDRRIVAGEEFDNAISKNLEEADIILLLVSPDFLNSAYCYDIEMQRAMERHERGEARVMPVILRPCDWHHAPFGKLLVMPTDGKPVTKFSDKDDAFLEVVTAIRRAADQLGQSSEPTPSSKSTNGFIQQSLMDVPRSSNLRIRKTFSDHDKDRFLEESFEYIANFFENSLNELSKRNPGIEARFKRVDANHFMAVVYTTGNIATQCRIWLGEHRFSGGIAYSSNASGYDNSFNESLSLVDDGYALFLRPLGLQMYSGGQSDGRLLSQQGAAEYFWDILIKPLQK